MTHQKTHTIPNDARAFEVVVDEPAGVADTIADAIEAGYWPVMRVLDSTTPAVLADRRVSALHRTWIAFVRGDILRRGVLAILWPIIELLRGGPPNGGAPQPA